MNVKKRGIAAALTVLSMLISIVPCAYAEEKSDYAEVVFGDEDKLYNITELPVAESMTVHKTIKGKNCLVGGKSTGYTPGYNGLFYQFDVNKELMYNLPEGTPVEVTVEYYDGDGGSFCIDYDSYNSSGMYENLNSTETVYLTGTNDWKTYTFYIEDCRMLKSESTLLSDFRLGMYGVKMGMSLGNVFDIAFASIKVEYADYREVLDSDLGSTKQGNIFAAEDGIEIKHFLRNKSDKAVSAEAMYKLYDSKGTLIEEYNSGKHGFDANGEKTVEFTLNNAEKFDIYRLECTLTEWYDDNPDEKKTHLYTESVSRAMIPKNGNQGLGACQQLSYGRGTAQDIGTSMEGAGLSMLRDDVAWGDFNTKEKQEKNIPALKNRIKTLNEHGVRFLALLWNNGQNPMSDGGNVPATESELDAWEEYCGMMARELKGYTDYFEIWNEYNITMFNTTNQTPEIYVELLKRAYRAIKKENPNAVVAGGSPSEVDLVFLENIFRLGALEHMDVVSVHPYDWTGSFREGRYVNSLKNMQELMEKYGKVLPIWNTELGFGTCLSDKRYGHTRVEQCASIVRGWILNQSNKLAEMWTYYMYTDMDKPDDGESCFGLVNCWSNEELTDYGAKESYLAVAAMNSLVGSGANAVSSFEDYNKREYAVNFYNYDLQKNVMVLESFENSVLMNFDLGCGSVDLLDMYGNKMATLESENGIYSFNASLVPVYVTGNFEKCEKVDTAGGVVADALEKTCVANDTVKFDFNYSGSEELYIETEAEKEITVTENNGFKNGTAELVLEIAPEANGKITLPIKIKNANGAIRYCADHVLNVSDPVEITISSQDGGDENTNHHKVRVCVKNVTQSKVLGGEVFVSEPEDVKNTNMTRHFYSLGIGKECVFVFNLPMRVVQNTVDLHVTVKLDSGTEYVSSQYLDFATAMYASEKPVIDGKVDIGEWKGKWIGCFEEKDVKENPSWKGPDDQSFSASMMWDEENFYMLAMVTDDVYSMNISPYRPDQMWQGDNMQFSIDDRVDINPMDASVINELSVGKMDGYGDICYRHSSYYGLPSGQIVENADICIKRYDNYTVYEIAMPWSELINDSFSPVEGNTYRFSVMINENDGAGRTGWMEYNSGIGASKQVDQFGTIKLCK